MVQDLYLAMVLAAFATFMITLGGVSTWQRLSARREESNKSTPAKSGAAPRLTPRTVGRPF